MSKKIILTFIISFILLATIQFTADKIIGPDSFYHLKIAEHFSDRQFKDDFSFLTYTILHGKHYVDHHWLFHFLLWPFTILPDFFNIKIAITFYSSLLLAVLFWLFGKLEIKHPWLWLITFLTASPTFLLRLNAGRPQSIGIILLLLVVYSLIQQKKYLLGIALTALTLLFNGFHIILPLIFFYLIADFIVNKNFQWSTLFTTLAGVALGLILHPAFPDNLFFWLEHGWQLTFSNLFIKSIPVGLEWQPLNLLSSFSHFNIIFILLIDVFFIILLTINKIWRRSKKYSHLILSLGISTLFYLLITVQSIRFIEYFIPLLIILTAYLYTFLWKYQNVEIKQFLLYLSKFLFKKPAVKYFLMAALIAILIDTSITLYNNFENVYSINRYQATAEWLKNNTPEHSIVFHASWDSFPRLFFWNHHNYYIVGMDPTFMYLYNKELYWLWRHITEDVLVCDQEKIESCGQTKNAPEQIAEAIKTNFNSEYIWVNDYDIYKKFREFLNEHPDVFEKKIESDDSTVFKIL